MDYLSYEAVAGFFREYLDEAVLPGAIAYASVLPAFVVIAAAWQFFAMPAGERSLGGALRQAFPFADFRTVSFRSDFGNFWVQQLLTVPLLTVVAKLLLAVFSAEVGRSLLISAFGAPGLQLSAASAVIVAIHLVMLFMTDEFSAYWGHYFSHKWGFWWASHRAHHSAEALTVFTAFRAHPLDSMLGRAWSLAFNGIVLGLTLYWTAPAVHPIAITLYGWILSAQALITYLGHSRARITYGRLGRVIYAPALHHIHHSAELHHRDKNFGNWLSLWDWMFGTLYIPTRDERWRIGLNDEEIERTNPHIRISDYFFEPIRRMFASLRPGGAHNRPPRPFSEKTSL